MPYAIEFAYYLSGPILAIAAIVGLVQLVITRKSVEVSRQAIEASRVESMRRAEAERTRLAVDLCIRFQEHVLPLIVVADKGLGSDAMPVPRTGCDPWSLGSYDDEWSPAWFAQVKTKKVIEALNAMEAIAIPFVWDTADRAVAQASIAVAFTEAAYRYAFAIAAIRARKTPESFPAVRQLCELWGNCGFVDQGAASAARGSARTTH